MFENLTIQFKKIIQKISGQGRLTEKNIQNTLREVRKTLLEADVAFSVIQDLIQKIKKKALGNKINYNLTPGQEFIKIVKKELINIIGKINNKLNLSKKKPITILFIGLQGVGKTTNLIKLGKLLQKKNKKILTVSTDIKREAALDQLKIISKKNKLDHFSSKKNIKPIKIINNAIKQAKLKSYDILLIDTSGRLHNNTIMMQEMKNIQKKIKPTETLLVIDSMTGQDSINIIKNYNKILKISGIILTKMDSNSRGGIALSCRYLTNIPIKFISNGENINNIEKFYPKHIINKILGMENIFSIIKNIKKKIKQKKINTKNNITNKKFDLNEFLKNIKQIKNFGGIQTFINNITFKNNKIKQITNNIDNKILKDLESIINSMNIRERKNPKIIKGSRKKRISKGSGVSIQQINILLKKFFNMKKIIKKFNQKGKKNIYQKIKTLFPNFSL